MKAFCQVLLKVCAAMCATQAVCSTLAGPLLFLPDWRETPVMAFVGTGIFMAVGFGFGALAMALWRWGRVRP